MSFVQTEITTVTWPSTVVSVIGSTTTVVTPIVTSVVTTIVSSSITGQTSTTLIPNTTTIRTLTTSEMIYTNGNLAPSVTDVVTNTVISFSTPETVVVTSQQSFLVATQSTTIISTSYSATVTTTYAAQCSGPSLINQVNGYGVAAASGAPGSASTFGGNGRDASACCQLCQENIGCAAFNAYPAAENFALHFTDATLEADGHRGTAFSYDGIGATSNPPSEPGQGFIVGTGCGTINPQS